MRCRAGNTTKERQWRHAGSTRGKCKTRTFFWTEPLIRCHASCNFRTSAALFRSCGTALSSCLAHDTCFLTYRLHLQQQWPAGLSDVIATAQPDCPNPFKTSQNPRIAVIRPKEKEELLLGELRKLRAPFRGHVRSGLELNCCCHCDLGISSFKPSIAT